MLVEAEMDTSKQEHVQNGVDLGKGSAINGVHSEVIESRSN